MNQGPEELSGTGHNPVGIPGAVLFPHRLGHHRRRAQLSRPIDELVRCQHPPFAPRHPRHSGNTFGNMKRQKKNALKKIFYEYSTYKYTAVRG